MWFSFAFSFFRLPFFFEHYLTSLVPFGTPALIEMCFHVNLQVELCSSILVETQLLSQNWFCILVELFGHKFDWLEEGIDGEQNRANASQCNWTFSLTISVEIQFFSFSLMQLRCTCIVVHLYLNNRKQLRCVHTTLVCEDSALQWETSFETVSVCIVYRICCMLKIVWHTIPCKAHCSTENAHLVLKDAQSCLQISTSSLLGGEVKQTKWPLFNTFYGPTLTSTV